MNPQIVDILKKKETCELIDSSDYMGLVKLLEPHWDEEDKKELWNIFSACDIFLCELIPVGVLKELSVTTSLKLNNYNVLIDNENEIGVNWIFYSDEKEKDSEVVKFKSNFENWLKHRFSNCRKITVTHIKQSRWSARLYKTIFYDIIRLRIQKQ